MLSVKRHWETLHISCYCEIHRIHSSFPIHFSNYNLKKDPKGKLKCEKNSFLNLNSFFIHFYYARQRTKNAEAWEKISASAEALFFANETEYKNYSNFTIGTNLSTQKSN